MLLLALGAAMGGGGIMGGSARRDGAGVTLGMVGIVVMLVSPGAVGSGAISVKLAWAGADKSKLHKAVANRKRADIKIIQG
jgi:hypothetical protein